jgi:hypothetical protein
MRGDEGAKKDLELQRLQRELDRATLQAQIAQQRRTALTESLPPSDTKPLEGTTTVDSADVIETEILAYRMLRKLAAKIAMDVDRATNGRAILIHHEADMTALTAFRSYERQLSQLAASFDELAPPDEQPADAMASVIVAGALATTAVAKTLVDLTALFRTDRNIFGVPITIEDLALVSEVGGALARKKRKVFVTQLYPRPADSLRIEAPIDGVRTRALAARQRIEAMPDGEEKSRAIDRIRQLDDIRTGYEDLFTGVIAEGGHALAMLIRGAGVDALLTQEPGASVLYLKILKAAGTNETKRNLLRSTLKRSGGVVVNYILFDNDGSILLSSTADAYSGEVDELEAE